MKKHIIISILAIFAQSFAFASETPDIVDKLITLSISSEGKYISSQDQWGLTYLIDVNSLKTTDFPEYYPGNGNAVSNSGLLAGQAMDGYGALMSASGDVQLLPNYGTDLPSSLNAITPDGTRVCGWVADLSGGAQYKPFYCDITDGQIGEVHILPTPQKDLLDDVPYMITGVWISEDGKCIMGQVVDGTGFFTYPIVFFENNGEWTYSLPSEPLFNPDNLPIPQWDPYNIDEYWREFGRVIKGCNFALGSMAMNPQGTMIAMPRMISEDENGVQDYADAYQIVIFDLTSSEIIPVDSSNPYLIPVQILADDTLVALDISTQEDFFLTKGSSDFISLTEYLKQKNSSWVPWIVENLTTELNTINGTQEVVSAGILSFSKDCKVMSGGCNNTLGVFSYIFVGDEASVEGLQADFNGKYTVYNMKGIKIMETEEVSRLSSLPKGLYIINGKKTVR